MHHAILRAITNYRIKLVSAREQMMVEEATRRARESAAVVNDPIVNPEMPCGTDGRGVGAPRTAEGGPALNPKAAGAYEQLSTQPQCISSCLPPVVPVACQCVRVSVGVSERASAALMAGLCRRASAAWGPPASPGAGQQQQQQQQHRQQQQQQPQQHRQQQPQHRHHDRRRRGGGEGGAASASASAGNGGGGGGGVSGGSGRRRGKGGRR
jgi:uncharacterized membrane protein YgcG